MIAFQPRPQLARKVQALFASPTSWEQVEVALRDPYHLLTKFAVAAWYERMQKSSQEITYRVRRVETVSDTISSKPSWQLFLSKDKITNKNIPC